MTVELIDNLTSPGTQVLLVNPCRTNDTVLQVNRPASEILRQPGGQFRVVVFDPSTGNTELMLVDSNTAWTSQWSVTRAVEGSNRYQFPQNAIVKHIVTAEALKNLSFTSSGGGGGGPTVVDQSSMTSAERLQFVMNIEPTYGNSENVPLFGTIFWTGTRPNQGQILWPDGGYGDYKGLKFDSNLRLNEYTVSYRSNIDTSKTDRPSSPLDPTTNWPTDPSIGWVPASQTNFLSGPPMSDANAAALVTRVPEVRLSHITADARIGTGIPQNFYTPNSAELSDFITRASSEWLYPGPAQANTYNPYLQFVTGGLGNYLSNPTTDEIIQWASHKWGMPTDWLRAQCHLESGWNNFFMGDLNEVDNLLVGPPGSQNVENAYSLYPAWCQIPGGKYAFCSVSLIQVMWQLNTGIGPGSDPLRWKSTAFALDYACSVMRYCLDDPYNRRTNWGDVTYVRGDYANVQGYGWNTGYPWGNSRGHDYQVGVFQRVRDKPWLDARFSDVQNSVTIYHQPPMTRDGGSGAITNRPLVAEDPYYPVVKPPDPMPRVYSWPGDGGGFTYWDTPADSGNAPWQWWLIAEPELGWAVEQLYFGIGWNWDGISNDVPVRFEVRGFNGFEWSPWSNPSNYMNPHAGLPRQPGVPGVSRDLITGNIIVSWTHPTTHADWQANPLIQVAIQRYWIMPRDHNGNFLAPIDTGSNGNSFVVPAADLTMGETYTFWVMAMTPDGIGPPSYPSAAITPQRWTPPSPPVVPPQNVHAYAGDGKIVVIYSLVDNAYDGGTPIQGYAVYNPDWGGAGYINMFPTVNTQVINVSIPAHFVVAAYNGDTHYGTNGLGPPSSLSEFVTPTTGLPDSPGNPTAAVHAGTAGAVDLSWSAPTGTVTNYMILPLIAGVPQTEISVGGTGTSFTATGLQSGVAYTFRIRAVNNVGEGPPSIGESSSVTPT